ncbi:MAG: DUF6159 family protein [Halobacteriota archaeon]
MSTMGVVSTLRTGLAVTASSLHCLAREPRLVVLPAAAGVAAIAFGLFVFATMTAADLFGGVRGWIALFVVYVVTVFLTSLFSAAIVHAVYERFRGNRPPLSRSVQVAWARRRPLFVWSVIVALVGLVLRWLTESDSALTRAIGSTVALGWAVTTFFVVPVVVFENASVRDMFTRSASTFRDTWGETASAGLGLGVVQLFVAIGAISVALAASISLDSLIGVPSGVYVWSVLLAGFGTYLFGRTIRSITKTALYVYATHGVVPSGFVGVSVETLGDRVDDPPTE